MSGVAKSRGVKLVCRWRLWNSCGDSNQVDFCRAGQGFLDFCGVLVDFGSVGSWEFVMLMLYLCCELH